MERTKAGTKEKENPDGLSIAWAHRSLRTVGWHPLLPLH